MPMSSDVTLPRSQAVEFPDNCIRCGKERPGETLSYSARESNLLTSWFLWWWPGEKVTVEVPACAACQSPLKWGRRWRTFITVAIIFGAVFACMPILDSLKLTTSPGLRKLLAMVTILVVLTPFWVYLVRNPLTFDLTVGSSTIDYEFADENFATAFAQLNGGVVN